MGRSSLQGTPWHVINRWQLKEKDEFEFENKKRKNKKKKRRNNRINYVELSKKRNPQEKTSFKGYFVIKFDDEEPMKYIIGENICREAEIVKMIYYAEVGDILNIGGDTVTIIEKKM